MMTYARYLTQLGQSLEDVGEEPLALELAFRHFKGWSKTDLVLNQRQSLTVEDKVLLDTLYQQLVQHRPYQYIIGQAEFCSLTLTVDERVLIPRPETEELVDLIISENPQPDLTILDIGTGSGAIGLALKATRTDWHVTATDISASALDLARQNAQDNHLDIKFIQSDLLDQVTGSYDIIVSNPPYIAYEDKEEVGLNVIRSEPHLALFTDEDGYAIYRRLSEHLAPYLKDDGKIYLEIGYKQGEGVAQLFKAAFPKKRVRVLKDSFGQDRMVVVDG